VQLAITALKITGQAMWDANDEQTHARSGFRQALQEPGRPHGLETQHNAAGRPVGTLACFAHGWDAGQTVLRLIRDATNQPRRKREAGPQPRA
jgi:hypothetical protein